MQIVNANRSFNRCNLGQIIYALTNAESVLLRALTLSFVWCRAPSFEETCQFASLSFTCRLVASYLPVPTKTLTKSVGPFPCAPQRNSNRRQRLGILQPITLLHANSLSKKQGGKHAALCGNLVHIKWCACTCINNSIIYFIQVVAHNATFMFRVGMHALSVCRQLVALQLLHSVRHVQCLTGY